MHSVFAVQCCAWARPMLSCSVRLTVCLSVTFVYIVKTNISLNNIFHRPVATPFLFFPTKPYGSICDFRPISGFGINHCWIVMCHQHFNGAVYATALMRHLSPTINKCRRATHQWILFMTERLDIMPKITEQNLIAHIGKSEAEVTNNKRLY